MRMFASDSKWPLLAALLLYPSVNISPVSSAAVVMSAPLAIEPPVVEVLNNLTTFFPPGFTPQEREEGHPCTWNIFEYSNETNVYRSRFPEWYANWRESMENNAERMTFGEVTLFARQFWNGQSYECSNARGGCHPEPSCKEIYEHLQDVHRGKDRDIIIEETRRAYFKMRSQSLISMHTNVLFRLLGSVQGNAPAFIEPIIKDFTPQIDAKENERCEKYKALIMFMVETAVTAIKTATLGSLAAVPLPSIYKLAELPNATPPSGSVAYPESQSSKYIETSLSMARHLVAFGIGMFSPKEKEVPPPGNENQLAVAFEDSMCDGAGRPDENADRISQLMLFTTKKFIDGRFDNLNMQNLIFDGILKGSEQFSNFTLTKWFQQGYWKPTSPQMRQRAITYEREWTNRYNDALISVALAASKTFIKCGQVPNIQEYCPWLLDDTLESASRDSRKCYPGTPDNDPYGKGTVCQISMWQQAKKFAKEQKALGLKKLKKYHLDSDKLIDNSLEAYWKYHNVLDFMQFAPNLRPDQVEKSSAAVPVCWSKVNKVTNFLEKGAKKSKEFPFSCGDFRSNDTRAFFDSIWIKKGSKNGEISGHEDRGGKMWKTFKYVFPKISKRYSPLRRYATLCQMEMSWPRRWDNGLSIDSLKTIFKNHINMLEKDERCDAILDKTVGMNELEANMWFCKEMGKKGTDAWKVRKAELPFMPIGPGYKYHWGMCKKFKRGHKKTGKKPGLQRKFLANLDLEPAQPWTNYTEILRQDTDPQNWNLFGEDILGTGTESDEKQL